MNRKRKVICYILCVSVAFTLMACKGKSETKEENMSSLYETNEDIDTTESTLRETTSEEMSTEEISTEDVSTEETTTHEDAITETTTPETTTPEATTQETTTIETATSETTIQAPTTEDDNTTIEETTQAPDVGQSSEDLIDITWMPGYVGMSGELVEDNADYVYSELIELSKNSVIKYRATGSTAIALLSLYDEKGNYIGVIEEGGKWHVIDRYYHAKKTCYVRICKRMTDNTKENCFEVGDYPTYILDKGELKESDLYGKSMLVIGDSLIHGNRIGNDVVWVNQLGMKYNMKTYNYGINGNTVSNADRSHGIPMSERYLTISEEVENPDIVIVEGGANDKNNNCIIGENTDNTNETFKGALNVLIDGLREKYPDKIILFMTCFERYGNENDLGLTETDYAMAMLEVCELKGIPCFNNVTDSGISLTDDKTSEWADEGIYLDDVDRKNKHFSPKAYEHLAEKYEKWIEENIKRKTDI